MPHYYAIFSAQFAPHVGGVEAFTENLAKELVRQGHAATVVTSRIDASPKIELRDDGATVFRLPSFAFMGGRLPISNKNARYAELMAGLEQISPDRVLVNTRFYRHSLEGLRFAKRLGIPAVVLDHGSAHLALGNVVADAVIEKYEHAITEKVKRFNPIFAGVSQKSIQWLQHFDIKTTAVISNGIDVQALRESASSRNYCRELNLGAGDTLISFVGRITPEKGPDKLLEALDYLQKGSSVHVALAGAGFLREKLEALHNPQVHFLGNLSREDLSALLQQTDIFCLPSRSEGFCTSLLEAAAWGVPSVITDVGGAREIIQDERAGRIIQSSNPETIAAALAELLALSPAERHAMGQKAAAIVERNFTWGHSVQMLDAAFEQ